MKAFYEIGYRFFHMPWEQGPRDELVIWSRAGRSGHAGRSTWAVAQAATPSISRSMAST